MNSTTKKSKFFFGDQRHIAAAYLNMARHNAFITLKAISARLQKTDKLDDEGQLLNSPALSALKSSQADVAQKAIRLFSRSFAFLIPVEDKFIQENYWKEVNSKPAESRKRSSLNETQRAALEAKAVPEDIFNLFRLIFKELNSLRNGFSHYKAANEPLPEGVATFDKGLISCLKKLFDDAKRSAKERKGFLDNELGFLDRMLSDTSNASSRNAGKHKSKKSKSVENPSFPFKFDDENGQISEAGLLFFTCMFLEANYANEFMSQFPVYKNIQDKRQKEILFAVFTQYRIRIPNVRIDSEQNENLLYLDMIGELQRCPLPLYEHLSQADKDRFKVKTEEEADFLAEPEDSWLDPVLKRHQDRFEYLAMRFIDESEAFKRLRFPIDLGNYHFRFYDKEIAGDMRIRRLTQKLIGFGRLQEFSTQTIAQKYGDLVLDPSTVTEDYKQPYIVKTTPHYHLYEGNIALYFSKDGNIEYPDISKDRKKWDRPSRSNLKPTYYLSRYDLPIIAAICALENKDRNHSCVEKHLLDYKTSFHQFLKDLEAGRIQPLDAEPTLETTAENETKSKVTETEIRRRSEKMNQVLVEKGFSAIRVEHLPKEIRNYLLKISSITAETIAQERLNRLIRQTELRAERLKQDTDPKNKNNKIGSKKQRLVLAGHLGIFLAEDMMFFQPPNNALNQHGGKATGLIFQVLEAALSQFNVRKEEIKQLFKECNLWRQPNNPCFHPFLDKIDIDKAKGVVDYYKRYLEERLKYLNDVKKSGSLSGHHFLRVNKAARRDKALENPEAMKKYIQSLVISYQEEPINVPRGFFQGLLKDLLKAKFGDAWQQFELQFPRMNASFMLQQYHQQVLKDDAQSFYQYKRNYKLIDQFYKAKSPQAQDRFAKVKPVFLSVEEMKQQQVPLETWISRLPVENGKDIRASKKAALREMDQNEKMIRLHRTQDIVLFMMVKVLIEKAGDKESLGQNLDQLKLRDIEPNAEKGILSKPLPEYALKITRQLKDITGTDYAEMEKVEKIVYQTGLKIKNYGDFRRFVKDRRLDNLLEYFDGDRIERSALEQELKTYDGVRAKVFEQVLKFEKAMLTKYPNIEFGNKNRMHAELLEVFCNQFPHLEIDTYRMSAIRNAFCHNQFPPLRILQLEKKESNFATDFLAIAKNTYGEYAKFLLKNQQQ